MPQDGLRGAKTRPTPVRPATREIKRGLNGVPSASKLANRASKPDVAVPQGASLAQLITRANRFRQEYDPLRRLTIRRAREMVDTYDRGEFATLQWTYRAIEREDETLSALITRRLASIAKLDWNIKTTAEKDLPSNATVAQADAQKITLRSAYDRIGNLKEAIEHLCLATFRGFAHLEKQDTDGDGLIDNLEPVDQWNLVRDGLNGDWFYNPTGLQISASALDDGLRLNPVNFVVRTVHRHVDWPALFCFIRKKLSQKDWDVFVEGYGLNPTIIIMPPNVPREREAEYLAGAGDVAAHSSGALPNGSEVKFANSEKGEAPFKGHIDEQKANVVLIGTGGKLTMLNGPTGLGSGQSESHEGTFAEIACAEAIVVSEILNAQFDKAILAAAHPGEPILAYFELAAQEETNPKDVIADIKTLNDAGLEIGEDEASEKTGYTVSRKAPAVPPGGNSPGQFNPADPAVDGPAIPPLLNRAIKNTARTAALSGDTDTLHLINTARGHLQQATADELAPLADRINALEEIRDEGAWRKAAETLVQEMAKTDSPLRKSLGSVEQSADVLAGAIGAGLVNGFTASVPTKNRKTTLAGRSRKTPPVARPLQSGSGERPAS